MLNMLHGEIVAVNGRDLSLLLYLYGLLTAAILVFNRQFLFISFDRETARAMGKHVVFWDVLLYSVIGMAIAMSVLIVGPMLTFAFLIIPPLSARRFCRSMRSFFILSSILGGLGGLLGFYLSYDLDWPLAPTDILVSGGLLLIALTIKKLSTLRSPSALAS
jgi:ABC-type Mn2+/Zn2+ transport system permease subunit